MPTDWSYLKKSRVDRLYEKYPEGYDSYDELRSDLLTINKSIINEEWNTFSDNNYDSQASSIRKTLSTNGLDKKYSKKKVYGIVIGNSIDPGRNVYVDVPLHNLKLINNDEIFTKSETLLKNYQELIFFPLTQTFRSPPTVGSICVVEIPENYPNHVNFNPEDAVYYGTYRDAAMAPIRTTATPLVTPPPRTVTSPPPLPSPAPPPAVTAVPAAARFRKIECAKDVEIEDPILKLLFKKLKKGSDGYPIKDPSVLVSLFQQSDSIVNSINSNILNQTRGKQDPLMTLIGSSLGSYMIIEERDPRKVLVVDNVKKETVYKTFTDNSYFYRVLNNVISEYNKRPGSFSGITYDSINEKGLLFFRLITATNGNLYNELIEYVENNGCIGERINARSSTLYNIISLFKGKEKNLADYISSTDVYVK